MKPFILPCIIAIIAFGTTSCKKGKISKGNVTVDSMQLQYVGGFPAEIMWNYYMIANGTVKEDTTTPFSNKPPDKFDKTLSQDKYNRVSQVLQEVPAQLLKENNTFYNSTSVVDAGSTRVIAYIGSNVYSWTFYEYTNDMPSYVQPFADKVHNAVHVLRE